MSLMKNIESIPEALWGFYREYAVSEQAWDNGELLFDGEIPVYEEVIYIEELPRSQECTREELDALILDKCGNAEDVVDMFIQFHIDTLRWAYHDTYTEGAVDPSTSVSQWKLDNYRILRKAAYGPALEQLEMQADGVWDAHIAAVKARYPKE